MRGARVAVEVELSLKGPRRLDAILRGYDDALANGRIAGGLIYVSDRPDVLDAVARAAGRVGLSERRFRLRPLEEIQADVHRLTRERAAARQERVASNSGALDSGRAGAHALTGTRESWRVDEPGGAA